MVILRINTSNKGKWDVVQKKKKKKINLTGSKVY